MCLLDYNKKNNKYKHLTFAERTMIETWYNSDHKSKKEIADLLHKSERTIRREINRGKVIVKNYDWTEKEEYSARIAQDKYDYGMTSKGPGLILDRDYNLVIHIEKEIKEYKKSPEVVSKQLKENGYDIEISGRTIRNAIKSGIIFEKIKQGKIIYKKEELLLSRKDMMFENIMMSLRIKNGLDIEKFNKRKESKYSYLKDKWKVKK